MFYVDCAFCVMMNDVSAELFPDRSRSVLQLSVSMDGYVCLLY